MRRLEGHNTIKSHTCQVGDPVTGKFYHRSSPTWVKDLSSMLGSLPWGKSSPRKSSFKGQQGLIKEIPQDWGNKLCVWRVHSGTHDSQWPKGKAVTYKRLGQTYLLVLEGLLQRREATVAHCGDKNTGSSSSGEFSLVWTSQRLPFSHWDLAPPHSL